MTFVGSFLPIALLVLSLVRSDDAIAQVHPCLDLRDRVYVTSEDKLKTAQSLPVGSADLDTSPEMLSRCGLTDATVASRLIIRGKPVLAPFVAPNRSVATYLTRNEDLPSEASASFKAAAAFAPAALWLYLIKHDDERVQAASCFVMLRAGGFRAQACRTFETKDIDEIERRFAEANSLMGRPCAERDLQCVMEQVTNKDHCNFIYYSNTEIFAFDRCGHKPK